MKVSERLGGFWLPLCIISDSMNDNDEKHQHVPDICWSDTFGQSSLRESLKLNLSCTTLMPGVSFCADAVIVAAATANISGRSFFIISICFFGVNSIYKDI